MYPSIYLKNAEKADLDIKTSVNKIGEIINLSQELNSILWDRLHNGASIESVMSLYCDIAQLDVMRKNIGLTCLFLLSLTSYFFFKHCNSNVLSAGFSLFAESDTMLLSDNQILIKAAKRNYDNFPVPTKLVEGEAHKRKYTDAEKAEKNITHCYVWTSTPKQFYSVIKTN